MVSEKLLARCVRGLEWVAANEITERLPEAGAVGLASREVTFTLPSLTAHLTELRTVDDVFVTVGAVPGVGTSRDVPPRLADQLARLDWAGSLDRLRALRTVPARPRLDVVASLDGGRRYNRYEVENALGALLAPMLGGPYLARTATSGPAGEPDVTARVRLRGSEAVAALRLGSRPAHRRAYKQEAGAGTLHPPVAAALARLACPAPGELLLDPFCGDGTIPIESSLSFPAARVAGSDLDPVRLANARRNSDRAHTPVALAVADAGHLPVPRHTVGVVVTNPPWNVSVGAGGSLRQSIDQFWRQLPDLMTREGRVCVLADAELDVAADLRRLRHPVRLAGLIRLAGRVSHVVFSSPTGAELPELPAGLRAWRERALAAGVITPEGY